MDSHNVSSANDFNYLTVPLASVQSDETSEACPFAASSSYGHGQYRFDSISQSDPECINPAFLECHPTAAMSDFFDDYPPPAPQQIEPSFSPSHPEGCTAMDSGLQEQISQPQPDCSLLTASNALNTSAGGCMSFDWPADQRGSLAMLHDVQNELIISHDSEHTANEE